MLVRGFILLLGSGLRTIMWMTIFAPCYSSGVGGVLVTGA